MKSNRGVTLVLKFNWLFHLVSNIHNPGLCGVKVGVMIATDNFHKVEVTSEADLRHWLDVNHRQQDSVWLVTFKKHKADRYVSVDQVLDQLLCFGWIDGLRRKLDDDRTMQLISRRKNQAWAKTYKDRASRLIQDGLMHQSGFDAIALSKANGRWDATQDVDAGIIPDDLARALSAHEGATAYFTQAAPSYQRNVLRWIFTAKTAATRQKRITQTAITSQRRERIPQL
jgi:uncharacterized protein YdeI (YjbR/CyaY-like superfamily)